MTGSQSSLDTVHRSVVTLVVAKGYDDVSLEEIAEHAGVEAAWLERTLGDKERCFVDAFDAIAERYVDAGVEAFESKDSWRDGIRAAMYRLSRIVVEDPDWIHFGTLQILRAGDLALAHRDRHFERFIDVIDRGRQELDDPDSIDRSVAEATMGAVLHRLTVDASRGRRWEPFPIVPQLMYIIVRPYLGEEAAREELSIPAPDESSLEPASTV